ncbi:hypothetical protein C8J57DRAFT_1604744 [Mycena rebaudengoi]|nr:hypothetical protein C8J57DRAFT_1604744 [Mycena rebaudengoi]
MASLTLTYGPLLFGGAAALILSGIVSVQCLIYFKSYAQRGVKKATVLVVWSVAAIQTWIVHLFYARTIHRWLSEVRELISKREELGYHVARRILRNPPAALSIPQWTAFIKLYTGNKSRTQFMFTMSLTISAGTDIGIAICLCYYLREIRRLSSSSTMKGVFDTLTIYTVENGLLTSITTIAALVCELREMHSGDQGIHFNPSVHLANYYTQFPHRAPAMSQATAPLTAPNTGQLSHNDPQSHQLFIPSRMPEHSH